jgi:tetratricopeptide (TPR) repeat protein
LKQRLFHITTLALFLLVLVACSTQKNTFMSRNYHSLTSHYNIYFNGIESYKKGIKKTQRSGKEDYSQLLPIFPSSTADNASALAPDMERTIKKSSKVISYHSITAKPKRKDRELTEKEKAFYNKNEYNPWIDDAYLLMGKAYFYKRDYFLAISTFRHIMQQFDDPKVRTEAGIFLARTYLEQHNAADARKTLDPLLAERNIPGRLKSLLNATYTDYYIKQNQLEQAIPKMEDAVKYARGKQTVSRYAFILAQMYQKLGNADEATRLYTSVIKMNPPYELTFNAKINRASTININSSEPREIERQLEKMLKDDKNKEYKDQIYYALGNIAFRGGREQEAISLYLKSARESVINPAQKGISYLTVADIYFGKNDYQRAQAFYDSAVTSLSNLYPGYESISAKSRNLNRLVGFLTTVEREDSLQRIAAMSAAERNLLIDGIIQKIRQEEAKQQQEKTESQTNTMMYYQNEARFREDLNREGTWYFYNQTAMTFGQTEFRRKWGDRKLEDNWRRKNKTTVQFDNGTTQPIQPGQVIVDVAKPDNKSQAYYLKDLPLNDSLLAQSHHRIQTALFNLGLAYRDEFKDYPKAVSAFEQLNNRYPGNENELGSYSQLYEINKETGNIAQSEHYRELILSKYPDSEYARMISDPDYFNRIHEQQKEVDRMYENAYSFYEKGDFPSAAAITGEALKKYPDHKLSPKFMYLNALARGRMTDMSAFKDMLDAVIAKYPDDEVATSAKEIVNTIKDWKPEIREQEETKQADELYAYDSAAVYYIAIVLSRRLSTPQLVFNITEFNIENYTNDNLETKEEEFDSQNKIITVRSFTGRKEAFAYFDRLLRDSDIWKGFPLLPDQVFLISAGNYPLFMKDKSLSKYLRFYKKQYIRS